MVDYKRANRLKNEVGFYKFGQEVGQKGIFVILAVANPENQNVRNEKVSIESGPESSRKLVFINHMLKNSIRLGNYIKFEFMLRVGKKLKNCDIFS